MMKWIRSLFGPSKTPPQKVVVVEGHEHVILIPPPVLAEDHDADIDQVVVDFIEREGLY